MVYEYKCQKPECGHQWEAIMMGPVAGWSQVPCAICRAPAKRTSKRGRTATQAEVDELHSRLKAGGAHG
jgi:hypothetical protein